MNNINPMIDRNPVKSLERAYNEAGEFQIYREMYMNSVEAGATKASLEEFHNKLTWLDDGCGISPSDLDQLINGRNSSSKDTNGRHGNFGVGLKDAGLFPNPHGLIVISKTEAHKKGGMIWLCIDPILGAGAKMLISDEMRAGGYSGNGESSIDFKNHDSFTVDGIDFMSVFSESKHLKNTNSGTAIILMGKSALDKTFPDVKMVRLYLQSRIYSFGIRVIGLREARNAGAIIHGFKPGHSKRIISTMSIEGFIIETSLYTGDQHAKNADDDSAARSSFTEVTLYKDEMYNVSFTSGRLSQMKTSRDKALKYGLIYPQIYNKVNIVIKPPMYDELTGRGCFPDSARSTLRWEDNNAKDRQAGIPYEMIQEYYRENMPVELRQLMNEIARTETKREQKTHTARLSKFFSKNKKSSLKLSGDGYTLMTSNSGKEDGGIEGPLFNNVKPKQDEPKPNKPKPNKPKPKIKNKPKPIEPTSKKNKAKKTPGTVDPTVIFSDEDATGAASAALMNVSGRAYPLAYEESTNRLYINSESPTIASLTRACLSHMQEKQKIYTVEMSLEQVFIYIIKPSLRESLPTNITHARSQREVHGLGIHPRNPEHIAFMLTGLWQFERFYLKHYKQFKLRSQAKVIQTMTDDKCNDYIKRLELLQAKFEAAKSREDDSCLMEDMIDFIVDLLDDNSGLFEDVTELKEVIEKLKA